MGNEGARTLRILNVPSCSGTSQLRHHSGPKTYAVKQRCRCSEVFKMADKLACRNFRRTIEHRPMEVQTK